MQAKLFVDQVRINLGKKSIEYKDLLCPRFLHMLINGVPIEIITYDIFTNDILTLVWFHGNHIDDKLLNIIKSRSEKRLYTKVIYDWSHEGGLDISSIQPYKNVISQFSPYVLDTLYTQNVAAENNKYNSLSEGHNTFYYDMFAADVFHRQVTGNIKLSTKPVNERHKNLNLLINKLNQKPSRLYTLYAFYKSGLLKNASVGIMHYYDEFEFVRKNNLINDDDFWQWFKENLGPAPEENFPGSYLQSYLNHRNDRILTPRIAPTGYPYNVELYDNTKISIVCETVTNEWGGVESFVTEKTYRTIVNKSPFIFQGMPNMLNHIRNLGFNTYEKFLSNKNYLDKSYGMDKNRNNLQKFNVDHEGYDYIKMLPVHAKELLDACDKYPDEIEEISIANQQHLLTYGKIEYDKLLKKVNEFINQDNNRFMPSVL